MEWNVFPDYSEPAKGYAIVEFFFSVPGFSNLFTDSALNALNLYMKYTAGGFSSYVY